MLLAALSQVGKVEELFSTTCSLIISLLWPKKFQAEIGRKAN